MDIKVVVAENISALLRYDKIHKGPCPDAKSLAVKSKLTPSTVGRILSGEQAPAIDTLDAIATAFGLHAWQLLISDLDPSAPPETPTTDFERDLLMALHSVIQKELARRTR